MPSGLIILVAVIVQPSQSAVAVSACSGRLQRARVKAARAKVLLMRLSRGKRLRFGLGRRLRCVDSGCELRWEGQLSRAPGAGEKCRNTG